MDFPTAVRTCLSNYARFTGRAARPEFWWFALFVFGASAFLGLVDNLLWADVLGGGQPLALVFSLAMILPHIAVAVRRLHDIGRSGWWLLIGLIPILGTLVLIYWFAQPSD